MAVAWRVVKARYAENALSGRGAERVGGRWTAPGLRAVYAAEHLSLAVLEILVHLGSAGALGSYVRFRIDLPDRLIRDLHPDDLPDGWRVSPPAAAVQAVGSGWMARADSAVLRVPSTVIPEERNFVLNPEHPDFAEIRVGEARPLILDPRLEPPEGR